MTICPSRFTISTSRFTISRSRFIISPWMLTISTRQMCFEYLLEKNEGAIKNEQSRDTSNIGHNTQNKENSLLKQICFILLEIFSNNILFLQIRDCTSTQNLVWCCWSHIYRSHRIRKRRYRYILWNWWPWWRWCFRWTM